ncbi:MAG: cupin domain-containing protein [Rhizobiaceae bacterium]|nr:cupin domain-containing protein [Rhizobiaceae bacterium]
MIKANDIITKLKLTPHPEGGHFHETFRDVSVNGRALSTAILYLLKAGEVSHWHRVDATEIWHWYGGAPLELSQATNDSPTVTNILGNDVINGETPQIIVPVNVWQSAKSLGDWTLVGCTVSPGFEFDGFEMAPANWAPHQ